MLTPILNLRNPHKRIQDAERLRGKNEWKSCSQKIYMLTTIEAQNRKQKNLLQKVYEWKYQTEAQGQRDGGRKERTDKHRQVTLGSWVEESVAEMRPANTLNTHASTPASYLRIPHTFTTSPSTSTTEPPLSPTTAPLCPHHTTSLSPTSITEPPPVPPHHHRYTFPHTCIFPCYH